MGKRARRSPRKHAGVTFDCESCGDAAQLVRTGQRYCAKPECRKVAKRGNRKRVELNCRVCGTAFFRKNSRQIRCGSKECERAAKRKNLGDITCPYCKVTKPKAHPWQRCCGDNKCRNAMKRADKASKRKHYGKTLNCERCGDEVPRRTHHQRFCPSSKKCKKPTKMLTCPYCEKRAKRRNTRQITCGSAECKMKRDKELLRKREPLKRPKQRKRCKFCNELYRKLSSIHETCNKPECAKKQKKARADEAFLLERRRNPKLCKACDLPLFKKRIRYHAECRESYTKERRRMQKAIAHMKRCPICEELVKDTRRTYHPACKRRLAVEKIDRKNYEENIERIRAEKAAAFKKSKPRRERRSPRMEDMKCVNSPLRTF